MVDGTPGKTSKSKWPELGTHLMCLKKRKKSGVAEGEWLRSGMVGTVAHKELVFYANCNRKLLECLDQSQWGSLIRILRWKWCFLSFTSPKNNVVWLLYYLFPLHCWHFLSIPSQTLHSSLSIHTLLMIHPVTLANTYLYWWLSRISFELQTYCLAVSIHQHRLSGLLRPAFSFLHSLI